MDRFYAALKTLHDLLAEKPADAGSAEPSAREQELGEQLRTLRVRFREAMDDDFNTARAIGCLFDFVRLLNAFLAGNKTGSSSAVLAEAEGVIRETGAVLGLFREDPETYLRLDREREAVKRGVSVAEVEALIVERRAAREAKDWSRADEIRKALAAQGVILKDTPTATTWTIA